MDIEGVVVLVVEPQDINGGPHQEAILCDDDVVHEDPRPTDQGTAQCRKVLRIGHA